MSRRDELDLMDYLAHIQEAISRIQRYLIEIDHDAFLANEEKQDAVIRNLEIIGEAAGNIHRHFPDFTKQHPDFPAKAAYGTRNALAHGYFTVDMEIVWTTIQSDLPSLYRQVCAITENNGPLSPDSGINS